MPTCSDEDDNKTTFHIEKPDVNDFIKKCGHLNYNMR